MSGTRVLKQKQESNMTRKPSWWRRTFNMECEQSKHCTFFGGLFMPCDNIGVYKNGLCKHWDWTLAQKRYNRK